MMLTLKFDIFSGKLRSFRYRFASNGIHSFALRGLDDSCDKHSNKIQFKGIPSCLFSGILLSIYL